MIVFYFNRLERYTPRHWVSAVTRFREEHYGELLNNVRKKSNQEHSISGHCLDDNGKRHVCLHEKKSKYQDKLLHAYRRKDAERPRRILELEKNQQYGRAMIHEDENR